MGPRSLSDGQKSKQAYAGISGKRMTTQKGTKMTDQQASTTDTTYNLISVIYHALQAVDTYHTYLRDADETGDSELSGMLQIAIEQQRDLSTKAKVLLSQRLGEGSS